MWIYAIILYNIIVWANISHMDGCTFIILHGHNLHVYISKLKQNHSDYKCPMFTQYNTILCSRWSLRGESLYSSVNVSLLDVVNSL